MKPMDYTGVFTGLEAHTIGSTSELKAGITTLSRKPHRSVLETKTAAHLHIWRAWYAFNKNSEASPKK
jgi:hypothetical protein